MSLEIDVLRALLRLARRRTPPTPEQLLVRVRGDERAIGEALAALARRGLVHETPAGLRLSLAGFAVAVAVAKRAAKDRTAEPSGASCASEARSPSGRTRAA